IRRRLTGIALQRQLKPVLAATGRGNMSLKNAAWSCAVLVRSFTSCAILLFNVQNSSVFKLGKGREVQCPGLDAKSFHRADGAGRVRARRKGRADRRRQGEVASECQDGGNGAAQ